MPWRVLGLHMAILGHGVLTCDLETQNMIPLGPHISPAVMLGKLRRAHFIGGETEAQAQEAACPRP